jgi:ATP-binding cassette, subfamily B, bacterial
MTDPQQYAVMDPYGAMPPVGDPRTWRTKGAWDNWKNLSRCTPWLRPYRPLYILVIVLTLLASIVTLAEPWPVAVMIDSVLGKNAPPLFLSGLFGTETYHSIGLLVFIALAGFMITIVGHGLGVLNLYASARLEQNMILDLRSKLFRHAESLSLTFHDSRFTGMLMQQINMAASSMGEIVMAFPPMFQNALTLIGMLVIALLIDWQVTLIALTALPFLYYAIGLYGTRVVPRIQRTMALEWGSLSIVYEAMNMLRVIVSFGREDYEHRRFRSQAQTAVNARVSLTVRQTLFQLAVTAVTALGTALVLGFGAWHVIKGAVQPGEMLVLISYIAAAYRPLEQLSNAVGTLHQHFVFLNMALILLDEEPEVVEKPDAVHIGRSTGQLTVEDLDFSYKGREDTIKDVSFEIEPGQHVAIVGPTGAGKTTLVNLMLRFYEPHSGRIAIDGTDITEMTLACLRDQITVVLQDPLLFSGTIAENIRYGNLDAGSDEVIEAARRANAHDFIKGLPNGYETQLGENGPQLSGGERQRICVARAFIKDTPILILDEPTSSIDSKTESVILDALDDLMVGRTSIMIAHRLSTIHNADLILVMNHGELVEQGSHAELIAAGGLYAQLYAAQTRIKSRTLAEGGAGHESELIDTITQELGEKAYGARDEDHPVEPAVSPIGVTPVEPEPAPPEPEPAAAEPSAPAPEPATPPLTPEPATPAAEPPAREPAVASGNGHTLREFVGPRPLSSLSGNGSRSRNARAGKDGHAANGNAEPLVKIVGERDHINCDFCGRTLLKGESVEPFVAPTTARGGEYESQLTDMLASLRRMQGADVQHKLVCEICWTAAEEAGWAPLPVVGGRR